jgi:transposase
MIYIYVAIMFVQATQSRRQNKTYVSFLVRESFRTAQGPRSRTVCNISALPQEVRELIAAALSGKTFVALEHLELTSALDYGGLAVLREAWQRFGLEKLFGAVPNPRQRQLLQAMIFCRILFPCAKLALVEEASGTLLAAACGLCQPSETFDEDDLYEAMDGFNGRWVAIEKKLYNEAFAQGVSLVLYDLTSIYFEGKGPRGLGAYGYSRDHREDRPQVLLAVATNTEGVPIHLEVLRGNRADTTTLHGLLASLKRRFGIQEAIFVFDNGMSSTLNLEAMRQEDLHFVTRLSAVTLRELIAQLPDDKQPQLWDRTQLIELTLEGKRYVVAGGEHRQQRDLARRSARVEKAQNELKRLAAVRRKKPNPQKLASQVGRKLQELKAHKYFQYQVDEQGQLQYQKNDGLIDSEQSLDGLYLLHTSLEPAQCAKEQVLGNYKNLMAVEDAFCQLKSYLEVRPVFHWRPDRVRNHVRLCFIAYWLCAKLAQEWRAKGENGEVQRLLRQLQAIRVGNLKIAGQDSKHLLTQIPPELNSLLARLGLLPLFAQPPDWAQV